MIILIFIYIYIYIERERERWGENIYIDVRTDTKIKLIYNNIRVDGTQGKLK